MDGPTLASIAYLAVETATTVGPLSQLATIFEQCNSSYYCLQLKMTAKNAGKHF